RNRVFAQAFSRDPEFFAFYRSLAAYERSLRGGNSTLVISPDSEFFTYLKTDLPDGVVPNPVRVPAQAAAPEPVEPAEGETVAPVAE
ncbi:MAG: protease modulator HflC, partial [Pseudomonadota bacterium]